mmetsp:Transcript_24419/g.75402  ORF Transcript_24419/g.75402 Transcript_24419/m.75402 type:complete len:316 (-) Transcript_24419:655-1602(-)
MVARAAVLWCCLGVAQAFTCPSALPSRRHLEAPTTTTTTTTPGQRPESGCFGVSFGHPQKKKTTTDARKRGGGRKRGGVDDGAREERGGNPSCAATTEEEEGVAVDVGHGRRPPRVCASSRGCAGRSRGSVRRVRDFGHLDGVRAVAVPKLRALLRLSREEARVVAVIVDVCRFPADERRAGVVRVPPVLRALRGRDCGAVSGLGGVGASVDAVDSAASGEKSRREERHQDAVRDRRDGFGLGPPDVVPQGRRHVLCAVGKRERVGEETDYSRQDRAARPSVARGVLEAGDALQDGAAHVPRLAARENCFSRRRR